MAKKRHSKKKTQSFNWKKNWKWLSASVVVLISSVYLFAVADEKSRIEHDLSVVGNGKPTVVQIHDPGCPLCRQLKTVVDNVKSDFAGNVQFKIADIKTSKGADFAKKYNVPHVTLLFFNANGRHVNTLQGVSTKDQVKNAVGRLK